MKFLGLNFAVMPPEINESQIPGEPPEVYLKRITLCKLLADTPLPDEISVACDTIVVLNSRILQKPNSPQEAKEMLTDLSGKSHFVISGIAIHSPQEICYASETTKVNCKHFSENQIENYIRVSKPLDKAGAYGIQDPNGPVENWQGSYSNVVGFPLRSFLCWADKWQECLSQA